MKIRALLEPREVSGDFIILFAKFFIPLYMVLHLIFFPYFIELSDLNILKFQNETFNELYKTYYKYLGYGYIFSGIFYFVAPKIMLPLMLLMYWLVQGPIMNTLRWHDQHVCFLMLVIITCHFFSDSKTKIPLRKLTTLFLAMFFFGAGLSKLTIGGLSWLDGYSAQFRFFEYYIMEGPMLGKWIAEKYYLCLFLTWLIVGFEIIFPVCLYYKKLQYILIWFSFLFICIVYITMKINFFWFLAPAYLVYLPWGYLKEEFLLKES